MWGKAYCDALDPAVLLMNTLNEPLMNEDVPAPWWHFGAVYCPSAFRNSSGGGGGGSENPHQSWAAWFATVSAQVANMLHAR
jgi:hypothetical protein